MTNYLNIFPVFQVARLPPAAEKAQKPDFSLPGFNQPHLEAIGPKMSAIAIYIFQGKNVHLDVAGESVFVGGVAGRQMIPDRMGKLSIPFEGTIGYVAINEEPLELRTVSQRWSNSFILFSLSFSLF